MTQKLTEKDFEKIAAQLRKPEGENGIKIAEIMNDGNKPMNMHTLATLDPQPSDSILEIGMGNGYFVKNIVNLDPSIRYTGCDYSELMVQKSTEINQEFVDLGSVKFVHANIQTLPFEGNSFNKIFTINTFYFWNDRTKVLEELKRVLKDNGTLIIAIRPKSNLEKFPVTKYNFAILSNDEIIQFLKDNGFNSIELTEIKEPIKSANSGLISEKETLILSCKTLENN